MESPDTSAPGPSIDVHVVRLPDDANVATLRATLDEHESQRADRLRGEGRVQYVAGRAALRAILSQYVGVAPAELGFVRTPHAAPRIATDGRGQAPSFSFSASSGLIAVAVSTAGCLGVDVERVTPERFAEDLVGVVLCEDERSRLVESAGEARAFWLASTWVAKEAVLKAWGYGLAVEPDALDAGLGSDFAASSDGGWRRMRRPADWWVWEVRWGDACLAVAAPDQAAAVRLFETPFTKLCPLGTSPRS